jgi:hypothetical protein
MFSKRLISSKRFRLVLSILIAAHLLAIFLPPLSFQTRGSLGQSPSVATLLGPLESYGQFLYIDRGYAFIAPDPGPSHLIQVAVTDPSTRDTSGTATREEWMYPDRSRQWPRLLYHRHFMLTEYLYEIYQPPLPDDVSQLQPDELKFWTDARSRYEHFRQSMIRHLEHENPNHEIAVRRIEHLIPDLVAYREQPVSLTDINSYRVLLDQSVELSPLSREGEAIEEGQLLESIPTPSQAAKPRRKFGVEPPVAAGVDEKKAQRPRVSDSQAPKDSPALHSPLDSDSLKSPGLNPANESVESVGAGS